MKKMRFGFTLIELLVVIGIIGMLSAVVISSIAGARNKATDAKIKSQLAGFKAAAEIYYDVNQNYGEPISLRGCAFSSLSSGWGSCSRSFGCFFDNGDSWNGQPGKYLKSFPANLMCGSNGAVGGGPTDRAQYYAIYSNLKSTSDKFWCIDSSGSMCEVSTSASPVLQGQEMKCNCI